MRARIDGDHHRRAAGRSRQSQQLQHAEAHMRLILGQKLGPESFVEGMVAGHTRVRQRRLDYSLGHTAGPCAAGLHVIVEGSLAHRRSACRGRRQMRPGVAHHVWRRKGALQLDAEVVPGRVGGFDGKATVQ